MADIIQFKSRAQIKQEEKERIQAEWEEWLAFEEQCINQELIKEENVNDDEQYGDTQMTHAEIVDDYKQCLDPEDVKEIEAFDNWLKRYDNNK